MCVRFSELWRRPKGVFITASDKGRMRQILDNVPMTNVHIIVVTDGGRILGLGDLGANGMGIPIGKIGLYVAGGGFDPAHALPVSLDFGTVHAPHLLCMPGSARAKLLFLPARLADRHIIRPKIVPTTRPCAPVQNNEKLLADPLYIGARHRRLPEEQYYELVDEFLSAVKHKWPKCLVQFEDFATHHSLPLLDKYRSKMLCFNDDIQGTGSVILGGLLNALKIQGTEPKDAKIVFYGAGSAAVGCAQVLAPCACPLLPPTAYGASATGAQHACIGSALPCPFVAILMAHHADDHQHATVARRLGGGRVQAILDDGLEGPPHV